MELVTLPVQPAKPDSTPHPDSYKTARALLALSQQAKRAGGSPEEAAEAAARFAEYCERYGLLVAPPPADGAAPKKRLSLTGRKKSKWQMALDAFYAGPPPSFVDKHGTLHEWRPESWKQAQEFHRIRSEGFHVYDHSTREWVRVREAPVVPVTAPTPAPEPVQAPPLVLAPGCPRCGEPMDKADYSERDLCTACDKQVAKLDPDTIEGERARCAQLEASGEGAEIVSILPRMAPSAPEKQSKAARSTPSGFPHSGPDAALAQRRREAALKAVATRRANAARKGEGA